MQFNDYYQQVYGDRWPGLLKSLEQKEAQVLFAPFAQETGDVEWLPGCWWMTAERANWPTERDDDGLLRYYVLDPASVLVARALMVNPGDQILDMCAAPGGKTLVLVQTLGQEGLLEANELSPARRARLTKVIQQYVPKTLRQRVFVKGKDALRFGLMAKESYDRILLDAPCSGERHLLANTKEINQWKPKRVSSLAKKQYSLLASGIEALKPGGRLVYSTCALSPEENDQVIARALKKKPLVSSVETPQPSPFAERTEYGWIHLPDKCQFGPLYFAVMEKKTEL
ncbi:MAG: RsmB/NOP family class I SAM-dependent RNA methyltransferase [Bdellovibrionaceae bacterium]|nr:RsmB/NOP family class I SAM-dependent RNA methyltransferase [Bdellovibrionales bacterium]MCB9085039.1 RsmB/NOP family class I SAM-dependent RNA methyltransferase [Pseudobdellovibrionaceae bacterium]